MVVYRQDYAVLAHLIKERREGLDNDCVVAAALTDRPKVVHCIPLNLIVAKMATYGLSFNDLKLILSYVQGWQQCVNPIRHGGGRHIVPVANSFACCGNIRDLDKVVNKDNRIN